MRGYREGLTFLLFPIWGALPLLEFCCSLFDREMMNIIDLVCSIRSFVSLLREMMFVLKVESSGGFSCRSYFGVW